MALRTREQGVGGALDALAGAARVAAQATHANDALEAVVAAAAFATGADVAVVRVLDRSADLVAARAVYSGSSSLAAELEGSSFGASELPLGVVDSLDEAPAAVARAAVRAGATSLLQLPIFLDGAPVGTLDLFRDGSPFSERERARGMLAAAQAGLVLRSFGESARTGAARAALGTSLDLAGDALAIGAADDDAPAQLLRLAAEASGASAALLWSETQRGARLVATSGAVTPPAGAAEAAEAVLRGGGPSVVLVGPDESLVTLGLGRTSLGALQLAFAAADAPDEAGVARLMTFALRAAQALRVGERNRSLASELDRTRALLAVLGQAIAQLSLAHTLDTAVERIAELLDVSRVAVYLREDKARLSPAAGRALTGPHAALADRLLELLLGPFRGRGFLDVADALADPRLAAQRDVVTETGIEAALAAPLVVRDDVIGLLAVYPPRGREPSDAEAELLVALAAQLAVAVQNARLHEQAKELGTELEQVLAAEREAAKQLRSLYEISRSFTQSLSLDATFEAVARTVVDLLGVDAAVIRTPDERREQLVARAVHVAEPRLSDALLPILLRPRPFATREVQRLFRTREPVRVEGAHMVGPGSPHELLAAFFASGSTAAVVPIATPGEVLGTLTLLSLAPGRPITDETIEMGLSIAGQAALAIDNARLYQQLKEFADTMQRSLLPRTLPRAGGLEIGDVYESSAHVEVGGDVYDYLLLPDGRLAVVLGDVTGHGIEATADMAMAKFVFRSLARRHPDPSAFLAAANEVVVDEIAPGKFITMAMLTIDPATGALASAAAGHPLPRLVEPDGSVRPLGGHGLALGIDDGQEYEESVDSLVPGAAVVLYTDGVIEARRAGELYGSERLDALLGQRRELSAKELARAVIDDCRAFAGGELVDDCAVVVIKRPR